MPSTKSWAAIAALPALLLASQAFAAVSIDFESEATGTSISTQYQAQGVVFSSPGNPTQPEINTFVLVTGERRLYGNILLKKGVLRP